jgi:hypothetical protein
MGALLRGIKGGSRFRRVLAIREAVVAVAEPWLASIPAERALELSSVTLT